MCPNSVLWNQPDAQSILKFFTISSLAWTGMKHLPQMMKVCLRNLWTSLAGPCILQIQLVRWLSGWSQINNHLCLCAVECIGMKDLLLHHLIFVVPLVPRKCGREPSGHQMLTWCVQSAALDHHNNWHRYIEPCKIALQNRASNLKLNSPWSLQQN